MQKTQETVTKNSKDGILENEGMLKLWKTPVLRILPVPTRTQGGAFNINDQDDMFYKKS